MISILSSNKMNYTFVYDLEKEMIVDINDNFSQLIEDSSITKDEVANQLKAYFSNAGIDIDLDGHHISWNFSTLDNKVVAQGNSIISLNNQTITNNDIHQIKLLTLGEMTAGIVHEINNPLGFIISNLETLKFEVDELLEYDIIDENKFVYLSKKLGYIEEGSSRVADIIEGVKTLAHKEELNFKKENILSVIEKSVAVSNFKIKSQGVKVKIKKTCINDIFVDCKKGLITQVIINLLQNAADAIENLPVFDRWVDIIIEDHLNSILIKVKDGGSGIDKEIVDNLFKPFFTTKESGYGTGLGLSLSKQILESHKAKLYVDDSDKNTCFIIEFKK
jgi:signal transduction histidine kinase